MQPRPGTAARRRQPARPTGRRAEKSASALAVILALTLLAVPPTRAATDVVADAIHTQLEARKNPQPDWVLDWPQLQKFYEARDWRPAWSGSKDATGRARILLKTLRNADLEGLNPEDYHPAVIRDYRSREDAGSRATLDLLLTDSFIHYSEDVRIGRLKPGDVDPDWHISPPPDGVPFYWMNLGPEKFAAFVHGLPPPQAGYQRLRAGLARYRKLRKDGGWPPLPPGPTLQLGDNSPRVGRLRLRLMSEGDLGSGRVDDVDLFGEPVREAVERFQVRHGLKPDGVVGSATREAMNVPASARIEQIRLNMDRWRWLPRDLGERYLMVNTAGYELDVVENDKVALSMRVITGQKDWMTPVLTGDVVSVQFNPYWMVPKKIALEELVPKQLRNPNYLASQKIRVFDDWDVEPHEVDPSRIDWTKLNENYFPYQLRQDPGPWNALGRIKFIFANNFAIFLHDTPHRRLFEQESRALSHGCVRVQHPLALATYLFGDTNGWTRERIEEVIDGGETEVARVPEPVPIYLVYWTAWVNGDKQVNFREDVYERDQRMRENGENPGKSAAGLKSPNLSPN
jgi:murein L,D-transpeptidase YcbB/YkuD